MPQPATPAIVLFFIAFSAPSLAPPPAEGAARAPHRVAQRVQPADSRQARDGGASDWNTIYSAGDDPAPILKSRSGQAPPRPGGGGRARPVPHRPR